jgi:plastocyanin
MRNQAGLLAIVFVGACALGCGRSDGPTSPSPGPNPDPGGGGTGTTTFTITASGITPRSITVPPGTRVTFVNNDAVPHEMNSDPHPNHGECPAIDQVGFLASGQSKQTGNLNDVRTCGFHDHNRPDSTSLQGTIVIRN